MRAPTGVSVVLRTVGTALAAVCKNLSFWASAKNLTRNRVIWFSVGRGLARAARFYQTLAGRRGTGLRWRPLSEA